MRTRSAAVDAASPAAAKLDPLSAQVLHAFKVLRSGSKDQPRAEDIFARQLATIRAAGLQAPWVSDPAYAAAAKAYACNQQPQQQQQTQDEHPPLDPGTLWELVHVYSRYHLGHTGAGPGESKGIKDDPAVQHALQFLKEAAWATFEQRGFEALRHAAPELREAIALTAPDLIEAWARQSLAGSTASEIRSLEHTGIPLIDSLSPQLKVVLLAEVVVGLTVPSQPLPPATPEHAAALSAAVGLLHQAASVEIAAVQGTQAAAALTKLGSGLAETCLGVGDDADEDRPGKLQLVADLLGWVLPMAMLPQPHVIVTIWLEQLQKASKESCRGPGGGHAGGGVCSHGGSGGGSGGRSGRKADAGPEAPAEPDGGPFLLQIRDHVRWMSACKFLQELEPSQQEAAAAAVTAAAPANGGWRMFRWGGGADAGSCRGSGGGGSGDRGCSQDSSDAAAEARNATACRMLLLGVAESMSAAPPMGDAEAALSKLCADAVVSVAGQWDALPPIAKALKDAGQRRRPHEQREGENKGSGGDGAVLAALFASTMHAARRAAAEIVQARAAASGLRGNFGAASRDYEEAAGNVVDLTGPGLYCDTSASEEALAIVLRALCLRFVLRAQQRGGPAWEDLVPSQLLLVKTHIEEFQAATNALGNARVALRLPVGPEQVPGPQHTGRACTGSGGIGAERSVERGAQGLLDGSWLGPLEGCGSAVRSELVSFTSLIRQLESEAKAYNSRPELASAASSTANRLPESPPSTASLLSGPPPEAHSDPSIAHCLPPRGLHPGADTAPAAAGALLALALRHGLLSAAAAAGGGGSDDGPLLGRSGIDAMQLKFLEVVDSLKGPRFAPYLEWLMRRSAGAIAVAAAGRMRALAVGSLTAHYEERLTDAMRHLDDDKTLKGYWQHACALGDGGSTWEEDLALSIVSNRLEQGSIGAVYHQVRAERLGLRQQQQEQQQQQRCQWEGEEQGLEQDLGLAVWAAAAPPCPFCERERKMDAEERKVGARRNGGGGGSGGGSSDGSCLGGAGDEDGAASPFATRRLIWRLLGKLRPSSRAWWERHAGMCPHCSDPTLWRYLVHGLQRQLVPLPPPLAMRRVAAAWMQYAPREEAARARAYALALERSFQQHYCRDLPVAAARITMAVAVTPASLQFSALHHSATTTTCAFAAGPLAASSCVSGSLLQELGFLGESPEEAVQAVAADPGSARAQECLQVSVLAHRALRPSRFAPREAALFHARMLGAVGATAEGRAAGAEEGIAESGAGPGGGGGSGAWRRVRELYGCGAEAITRRTRAAAFAAGRARAAGHAFDASSLGDLVTDALGRSPRRHLEWLEAQCAGSCTTCGQRPPPGEGAPCAGCGVAFFCGARCRADGEVAHAAECLLLQGASFCAAGRCEMIMEAAGASGALETAGGPPPSQQHVAR